MFLSGDDIAASMKRISNSLAWKLDETVVRQIDAMHIALGSATPHVRVSSTQLSATVIDNTSMHEKLVDKNHFKSP